MSDSRHFVLVHGACHGAWCWYRLIPRLRAGGHRVTAIDLEASGVRPEKASEVRSLAAYTQPLMEAMASLDEEERVVLVAHSMGGLSVALAAERFPEKVAVAVFVASFMPDSSGLESVLRKHEEATSIEAFLDSKLAFDDGPGSRPTSVLFGPKFLSDVLYQHCSVEDITLATMLVRPCPSALEDVSNPDILTTERYGSVSRAYFICNEDRTIKEELQRWMVENSPPEEVRVIEGSDHMPMLSYPQVICDYLLEIANIFN